MNIKQTLHVCKYLLLFEPFRSRSNSRPNITSSVVSPKLSSLNGFQSAKPADSGRFGELNKDKQTNVTTTNSLDYTYLKMIFAKAMLTL